MNRLLIVKLSSLGDVLHALPVVKSIKQGLPHLSIGWVIRERCAGLLLGNDFLDDVYVIPNKPSIKALWKLRQTLRRKKYDTAFDMQGLLLSGVITALSGAPRRVGLNRNREMNAVFLSEPTIEGKLPLTHAVDVQLGFRGAAGLPPIDELPEVTYLAVREADWLQTVKSRFNDEKIVVLNVGASTIYKRWPNQRWIELANALTEQHFHVVLTAGPTEADDADRIAAEITRKALLTNLGGITNSDQLATILRHSNLVITGDTGPLHMAASVGTPTIALFGPTDPRLTGPYGKQHKVIWKQLSCSPCFRHPTCNGRVDCLTSISADEVLESAVQSLKDGRRSVLA
jgi:lipopolysaccharide heptosyltransferase I